MKYLVDSNIIIYHLAGKAPATKFIQDHFDDCGISFITCIEVLSFDHPKAKKTLIEDLLAYFIRIDINDEIIQNTISLRLASRTKLPDCIIAASAISNHLTLVTRNLRDFASFKQLKLLNPFAD